MTSHGDLRVHAADGALVDGLAKVGGPQGDLTQGLVCVPAPVSTWAEAEDELALVFGLTQEAVQNSAPVVYVLRAAALLGRAAPLDCAVAAGLAGGVRALAYEGQRNHHYATAFAVDDEVDQHQLVEAIQAALATRSALGQTVMLGSQHLGALLP